MSGQAQLVIFVSSLGVCRETESFAASPLRRRPLSASSRAPAAETHARALTACYRQLWISDTEIKMTGPELERSLSVCAHGVFTPLWFR